MPFQEQIRIGVAGPSDVTAEKAAVLGIISHWNTRHVDGNVVFASLTGDDVLYDATTRAQQTVNDRMDTCQALIAIFGHRFGSSTGVESSGTREEITRAERRRVPIYVFFSNIPIDPSAIDAEQLARRQQYEHELRERHLGYQSFESLATLKMMVRDVLDTLLAHLPKDGPTPAEVKQVVDLVCGGPEHQGMVLTAITDNQVGWDFPRALPEIDESR